MSNVRDLIRAVARVLLVLVGGLLVFGWTVEGLVRLDDLPQRVEVFNTFGDPSTLYGLLFTPEHLPLTEVLFQLLPCAVVAVTAVWAGWRAWRGRRNGTPERWSTGLGLAVLGGALAALGWVLVLVDTQPKYWTAVLHANEDRPDEALTASAPDWATWDDVDAYRRALADASEDLPTEQWWTRYTPPGPSVPPGRPDFLLDRFLWENDLEPSAPHRPSPSSETITAGDATSTDTTATDTTATDTTATDTTATDTTTTDTTATGTTTAAGPFRLTMRPGVQSVLDDRAQRIVEEFARSLHRGAWQRALAYCSRSAVQKSLWSVLHDRHDAQTRIGTPAARRVLRSVALQVGGVAPRQLDWRQVDALDLRYAAPIATSADDPLPLVIIDGILHSDTKERPLGTVRIVYAPTRTAIHGANEL
jgi:hypothetical protein